MDGGGERGQSMIFSPLTKHWSQGEEVWEEEVSSLQKFISTSSSSLESFNKSLKMSRRKHRLKRNLLVHASTMRHLGGTRSTAKVRNVVVVKLERLLASFARP